MFSFLVRLFRRKDILDDAETAYIEGRTTEAQSQEFRHRITPERVAELESLRATVRLLRSVQSEMAPRSFALAEAPAYARSMPRRTAFAPAMAAIIAALGVGLLAVGDLTGYVSQSGSDQAQDGAGLTSAELREPDGPDGPQGPPGPAGEDGSEPGTESIERNAATSVAATPTISVEEMLFDSGYGIISDQAESLQATIEAGGGEATWSSALTPAQEATRQEAELSASDSMASTGDDGITLPLWQLQSSLAGLAALMIAAWAFIRRRATA